jgi:hypothetical protein
MEGEVVSIKRNGCVCNYPRKRKRVGYLVQYGLEVVDYQDLVRLNSCNGGRNMIEIRLLLVLI